MSGFAVLRLGFKGCGNRRYRFSLICSVTYTVYEEFDLPFGEDERVGCNTCGGLLYLYSVNGTIVVCNVTTAQMKILPPPIFEPHPHVGTLTAIGLGFDPTCKEYKVVRNYVQYYYGTDEDSFDTYCGSESHFELYSFNSGLWEAIPALAPTTIHGAPTITQGVGVYAEKTGCCYWIAMLERVSYGKKDDPFEDIVLAFDFATKKFSHFGVPVARKPGVKDMYLCTSLFECNGWLGAVVYWKPRPTAVMSVELYIWNGTLWEVSHTVSLPGVSRVIGLIKGRTLALEAKHSSKSGQLMLYDMRSGMERKLDIFDVPSLMTFHYVPYSEVTLPESDPITYIQYDASVGPVPVVDDEEEKKLEEEEENKFKMMLEGRAKANRAVARANRAKARAEAKAAKARARKRKRTKNVGKTSGNSQ